jgi:hypothetical protein
MADIVVPLVRESLSPGASREAYFSLANTFI